MSDWALKMSDTEETQDFGEIVLLEKEQLTQMSFDAVVDYALKVSKMNNHLASLETRIKKLEGNYVFTKNSNSLMAKRIETLEKRQCKISQYSKNRQLELHRVPEEIEKHALKKSVTEFLSLTGQEVKEEDLDKCHRLKGKNTSVILEFRARDVRDTVFFGRKNLKGKIHPDCKCHKMNLL